MLRITTAGESHGIALVSILEGMVAGLPLVAADVDVDLARRQQGYGRGRRMKIESDHAEFLSGVRAGETIGSPIAMLIQNRDWKNWQEIMDASVREEEHGAPGDPDRHARPDESSGPASSSSRPLRSPAVPRVRPGHAERPGLAE